MSPVTNPINYSLSCSVNYCDVIHIFLSFFQPPKNICIGSYGPALWVSTVSKFANLNVLKIINSLLFLSIPVMYFENLP